MQKRLLRLLALTYILVLLLPVGSKPVSAEVSSSYPIHDIITNILDWKTDFLNSDYILKSSSFLSNVGEPPYNDYAFSLARLGTDRGYDSYLSLLYNRVSSLYAKEHSNSSLTLSDWQNTSLTLLALGGDPANMTNTINETKINLLADYGYNYASTVPIEKMDTKELVTMLFMMDALDYSIPESSIYTRRAIIFSLLSRQQDNGAFASDQTMSDTTVTALVIQALAPFYNDETLYDRASSQSVSDAIEHALDFLSSKQTRNGDIKNGDIPTLESTVQTLLACVSMGIDPYTNQRFILNNHNLLDGVMRYQVSNGGFTGQITEGTTAIANDASSILALNGLISFYRFRHHQRDLYDMRAEFSAETKQTILELEEKIMALSETASKEELETLYQTYLSLPASDRRYIYHYKKLSKVMDAYGIPKDTTSFLLGYNQTISGNGTLYNIILNQELTITKSFTMDDYYRYIDISDPITSNNYNAITELYCKLANTASESFYLSGADSLTYEDLLRSLKLKKTSIETVLAKIDSINEQIQKQLPSLEQASKKDKELIDRLVYQASTLSPIDQKKILYYKELLDAKDRLSPETMTVKITVLLFLLFLCLLLPSLYHHIYTERDCTISE